MLRQKFSELGPLDKASPDVKDMADELQKEVRTFQDLLGAFQDLWGPFRTFPLQTRVSLMGVNSVSVGHGQAC